jgi:hypothetical protein
MKIKKTRSDKGVHKPASEKSLQALVKYRAEHPGEKIGGIPLVVFDAKQLQTITKLRAVSTPIRAIARAMGVSNMTFNAMRERQPEVQDALDAGDDMLYNRIISGRTGLLNEKSFVAKIFLAKALLGLRDGESVPGNTGPRIVINMPGAQPLSKVIEGQVIREDDDEK